MCCFCIMREETYVGNVGHFSLDTLALTHVEHDLTGEGGGVKC